MKRLGLAIVLAVSACTAAPEGVTVTVLDVIDGDTIRVLSNGSLEDVRLVGINSPEWVECQGPEAAAALEEMLERDRARLVVDTSDRDQYGRLLRLVFSEGDFVNESLVRAGLAIAFSVPPDVSAANLLSRAEESAERSWAGIWDPSACGPPPPPGITIEGIHSGAGWTGEPIDGESAVIRNIGASAIELTDWTLRDASSHHRYRFPALVVEGGGRVVIETACGSDRPDRLHWCSDSPVWNDARDHAFLLDIHGNIASHLRY
ncbi:MAG: thermonuclease family protein [Acidimicrobiia bacterium]